MIGDTVIDPANPTPVSQNTSTARFANVSHAEFVRSDVAENRTYSIPDLEENGICQQQSAYKWGFSWVLLFTIMLMTAIWVIGMFCMSRYAQSSRLGHGERYIGTYRAVLDLAEAPRKDVGESTATQALVGRRNQGTNYRRRWQNRFQGHGP